MINVTLRLDWTDHRGGRFDRAIPFDMEIPDGYDSDLVTAVHHVLEEDAVLERRRHGHEIVFDEVSCDDVRSIAGAVYLMVHGEFSVRDQKSTGIMVDLPLSIIG